MPALTLLLLALGAVFAVLWLRTRAARADLEAWLASAREDQAKVEAENQALAVFRPILDAQAEAARLLGEADQEAARRTEEADELIRQANIEANRLLTEARRSSEQTDFEVRRQHEKAVRDAAQIREKADADAAALRALSLQTTKEAKERADATLRSAQREAQTILDNANKRGEEIAGTAFEALRNAERFEQVAKAMKNLIEGYGDQYVIPSRSLLDELADDYNFTEAGEELKHARERARQMVKGGTAATCDYVENHRRETAIRFVVDAFNGKVDSILSRTKTDNVGKLEQEIRDAFHLVNHNGAAFRSARIEPAYLEARLTELRWGATTLELRNRDKEEQRRIKEQIREEERAQREFERSLREAAKEEESLRKAMEKLQGQVEKATEEQRAKYEAQLAEMAEKLRQAEERSQRALSMAQQTRMGHVYVISNLGSFGEDVFKIGLTRRLEPLDRVRELGDASVPFAFDVHAMIFSEDAPALELALHRHFVANQVNKVNPRKEFFRVPIATIKEELDQLGIQAQWTMAAQAREYRETLAIERALAEDPAQGQAWLERQAVYQPAVEEEEEAGVGA